MLFRSAGPSDVMMNQHKQRSRGFTLIELVVVVAVLGVLAAVAFPGMRNYMDKQRLVSQVRAIAELAQVARAEAIKHSSGDALRTVSMTVSPAGSWFVGLSNGAAACTTPATCKSNEGGALVTKFASKIAIAATGASPYIAAGTAPPIPAGPCPTCTFTSPGGQQVVTFDMRGLVATGGADLQITMQSPLGKQLGLSVSRLGRISLCTPGGSVGGYPTC